MITSFILSLTSVTLEDSIKDNTQYYYTVYYEVVP